MCCIDYLIILNVLALFIGWPITKLREIKVDRHHQFIQIESSWINPVIILIIFLLHYVVGCMNAVCANAAHMPTVQMIISKVLKT